MAAGLPVPPAIALGFQLARQVVELDSTAREQARKAAHALGYPLAVRSSADIEDLKGAAAPGLFETVLDVNNDDQLFDAIAKVVASGRTPLVNAYLQARGMDHSPKVAVILQEQIMPTAAQGVLYSRPPGQPRVGLALLEVTGQAPLWLEREDHEHKAPASFPLSSEERSQLWGLACQAEKILDAKSGLDIEWVWDERGPWLVQARPIVHREDLQAVVDPRIRELVAFSRADADKLWRLDATHNPLPLSPAQSGLVHAVRDLAPYDMRVVGGYLYTAKRQSSKKPESISREALRHLFHETLLPKMDAALAPVEADPAPSLASALAAYQAVFKCYTEELAPKLAAAGGIDHGGNPLSRWLLRARQGLISRETLMRSVAPMAPAWDVSVPTYGETPELVEHALLLTPPPGAVDGDSGAGEDSLSETDDLLFYRAQYLVRRALLVLAARWQVSDEIFFMPFARLLEDEGCDEIPDDLLEEARTAAAAFALQQDFEMPMAFAHGEPVPTRLPPDREIWLGLGTGGYVRGTVVRVARLADIPKILPGDQTVLVMPTVSPAHALSARGSVAVVCEYGEHLGHGAAMARELGIPCIVGCKRAWRELRTGDRVAVHGQAGLVARLG
jgi:pyruvate,water dikinase